MTTFKEYYIVESMEPAKGCDFKKDSKNNGTRLSIPVKIDGIKYQIDFWRTDITGGMKKLGITKNAWAVQFAVSKSPLLVALTKKGPNFEMQNLNKGMEFKLMPIVLAYILSFVEQQKPDALKIIADKKEESRVRVYGKILNREKPRLAKLGYKGMIGGNTGSHEAFMIYKDTLVAQ